MDEEEVINGYQEHNVPEEAVVQEFIEPIVDDEPFEEIKNDEHQKKQNKTKEKEVIKDNNTYVHELYEEFNKKYVGIANLEREWNQLRSQINSGLRLGISQKDIRLIFTLEYSYEQREILKLALYIGLQDKVIKKLTADKTPQEMLLIIENSKLEETLTDAVSKPIAIMSASLNDYIKELDRVKAEYEKDKAELTKQIEELKADNNEKKAEIEAYEAANKELEIKNQIELKAEQLAKQKINAYNQNYVPEEQQQAPVIIQPQKKKWFTTKKEKNENVVLSMANAGTLPRNFDISSYIASANLTTSQMKVINYAINYGLSNNIIVTMVENQYSAEKMQQYVGIAISQIERQKKNNMSGKEPEYEL